MHIHTFKDTNIYTIKSTNKTQKYPYTQIKKLTKTHSTQTTNAIPTKTALKHKQEHKHNHTHTQAHNTPLQSNM